MADIAPDAIRAEATAATDPARYVAGFRDHGTLSSAVTSELVKGVGYYNGGNAPESRPEVLAPAALRASEAIQAAVKEGYDSPNAVIAKSAPEFQPLLKRLLLEQGTMGTFAKQVSDLLTTELKKDISLSVPLSTGLVPFDLSAPARLLYPVYSPLRDKLPRTKGQGTSRRAKLITGIPGSGTGGAGNASRWGITELNGQAFSNWPINLPPSTQETSVDLQVPYKFFGQTEPISWLAEFSGRGFEDIAGLANLLLLQKAMLNEEYTLLGGVSSNLTAPATPTGTLRAAGSGESALSGITTNLYVLVTAVNMFGNETAYASGSVLSQAPSTQVLDLTITPSKGATTYNVYVATGASNPGRTGFWLMKSGVGATKVTLQGAIPTSGTNPQSADSGTGSANEYDGLISILAGQASGTYSVGAGYYNPSAATTASVTLFNTALEAMWKASKARPSEIVMEGSDIGRLSDDIRANPQNNAYRLAIAQDQMAGIRAGAAVAEFVNPVTREVINLMVHPWLPQGNSLIMSYQTPFPWSETPNCWEVVNVQDYLSISWPVIDMTYRYSLFLYGALVGYAPLFSGLIQGLQQVASGTLS